MPEPRSSRSVEQVLPPRASVEAALQQLTARVHRLEQETERLAQRVAELEAAEGGPELAR